MKTLKQLLDTIKFNYSIIGDRNIEIHGIKVDSRAVNQGDLFICLKGYTVDGHRFVDQAVSNGAVAIVAEEEISADVPVILVADTNRVLSYLANVFFDFPTNDIHLIGVTGTNGKTSITYLLDTIFTYAQKKTALIGTIQMKIGDHVYPTANTTPEPSYLFSSFKKMVDQQIDHCMMEVSSHALELGRVNGCDFDLAIFTNLSQDHLDFHGSIEDYVKAKQRLFYQLGNSINQAKPKYAIINHDDQYANDFIYATSQPVITYGLTKEADVYADDIVLSSTGSTFSMHALGDTVKIKTPLMGQFNIYNILAAATAASLSGVELNTIKESIEQITGVRGRFEPVKGNQPFGVIIDYAHTPDSLENVLTTIKSFVEGKIYLVVGCGGDRDRTKRPLMAAIGETYADYMILTSDNPRSENPMQIIVDMETGLKKANYKIELDREQAIIDVITMAEVGDVVLIAGKGHETYQIIADQTIDFDDYQIASQALNKRYNASEEGR
ncbi:UDP-N-acetylmuramoylalanyl-D-glutamate--2,6-diaminopimelate ligase [Amphibacillus marinus]|uniref:UDP-N-acetylmuramoyl-L-alanyl-D-glutamate--2,6-diaminopimelate ligase n=1 Tax=Amphibacillus marinus TaxID=872970 RepID=A0A1H8I3R9_9BACI|nr:UDP-N-acetylmuramoyl-L-alanyl-D-glutamate--2,6-diaminopimelate ligase [Amphibacillus marinus]SEN63420.1 UDP-N-acetylmuramoylalanyl-D-glutamate--2,6-diaminopimelate ligase [Amphibacillus marinus]